MGPITVLTAFVLLVIGLTGLAGRRSLLPELTGPEAALVSLPFGVVLLVIGLVVWGGQLG